MKRIEFEATLENEKSTLYWNYRIPVESKIADSIIGKDKRVNCVLNNEQTFSCALIANGKGEYFINVNKSIRNKLELEVGQRVKVLLIKDDSEYGMPLPPSFEELLYQDPEGKKLFDALTPGRRRSLIYVIAKLKSEQKQLEKGLIIIDYLKETNGVLEYKGLNEAFKSNRYK